MPKETTFSRFELVAKVVAIVGGIISAIAIVITLHQGTEQRKTEHRWRQAEMAMKLLDAMWADPLAVDALRMIDWGDRTYQGHDLDPEKVAEALNIENNLSLKPEGVYVRESFDRLFYHLERLERSATNGLIKFEDVQGPLNYYVPILRGRYEEVYPDYMDQLGFSDAKALLRLIKGTAAPSARSTRSGPATQRGRSQPNRPHSRSSGGD